MVEGWENHFYKPSYTFHTKENKLQIVPLGDLACKQQGSYSI